MTQDAHLKIVSKTGSSTYKKQHAVRCEYIHTEVNGRQLTIYHVAGVSREPCDPLFAVCNGKPPWSTKSFLRAVHEIENHDFVSGGISSYKFRDKGPP